MRYFLLIVLLMLIFPLQARSSCLIPDSSRLGVFAQDISRAAQRTGIWPKYEFAEVNLIVVDSDSSKTCAFVHEASGREWTVELTAPLSIPNGAYDYCRADWSQSLQCPDPFKAWPNGVLFDIAAFYKLGGERVATEAKIPADMVLLQFLIHETFHHYGQSVAPGSSIWPGQFQGVAFDTRQEIKAKCYGLNPEVAALARRELELSYEALAASASASGLSPLKERLALLVETRKARYQRLEGVKLDNGRLDCRQAEDQMEMVEGAPDFASFKTLFKTKLMNFAQLPDLDNAFLKFAATNSQGDFGSYYVIGSIELFAIDTLDGGVAGFLERARLQPELTLFGEIERAIGRKLSRM